MEATTSKEGGLNERGPKAIAHEMGLQVSHGVHSEVGGIQCGGIHQGEECNLDCPELSGTETPFDREEFLSARLFRFHGGDGQTIRAGIHLAAGAGGAAFGGAEHGVGASAAFRRLLTGPFEGLTEISPRLCRGSFNSANWLVNIDLDCVRDSHPTTKGSPVRRHGDLDWALSSKMAGGTPLFVAANYLEVEIMRALTAAGADPGAAILDGTTPMMVVAGVRVERRIRPVDLVKDPQGGWRISRAFA